MSTARDEAHPNSAKEAMEDDEVEKAQERESWSRRVRSNIETSWGRARSLLSLSRSKRVSPITPPTPTPDVHRWPPIFRSLTCRGLQSRKRPSAAMGALYTQSPRNSANGLTDYAPATPTRATAPGRLQPLSPINEESLRSEESTPNARFVTEGGTREAGQKIPQNTLTNFWRGEGFIPQDQAESVGMHHPRNDPVSDGSGALPSRREPPISWDFPQSIENEARKAQDVERSTWMRLPPDARSDAATVGERRWNPRYDRVGVRESSRYHSPSPNRLPNDIDTRILHGGLAEHGAASRVPMDGPELHAGDTLGDRILAFELKPLADDTETVAGRCSQLANDMRDLARFLPIWNEVCARMIQFDDHGLQEEHTTHILNTMFELFETYKNLDRLIDDTCKRGCSAVYSNRTGKAMTHGACTPRWCHELEELLGSIVRPVDLDHLARQWAFVVDVVTKVGFADMRFVSDTPQKPHKSQGETASIWSKYSVLSGEPLRNCASRASDHLCSNPTSPGKTPRRRRRRRDWDEASHPTRPCHPARTIPPQLQAQDPQSPESGGSIQPLPPFEVPPSPTTRYPRAPRTPDSEINGGNSRQPPTLPSSGTRNRDQAYYRSRPPTNRVSNPAVAHPGRDPPRTMESHSLAQGEEYGHLQQYQPRHDTRQAEYPPSNSSLYNPRSPAPASAPRDISSIATQVAQRPAQGGRRHGGGGGRRDGSGAAVQKERHSRYRHLRGLLPDTNSNRGCQDPGRSTEEEERQYREAIQMEDARQSEQRSLRPQPQDFCAYGVQNRLPPRPPQQTSAGHGYPPPRQHTSNVHGYQQERERCPEPSTNWERRLVPDKPVSDGRSWWKDTPPVSSMAQNGQTRQHREERREERRYPVSRPQQPSAAIGRASRAQSMVPILRERQWERYGNQFGQGENSPQMPPQGSYRDL